LTNEAGDIVESFLYDEAYGTILDHHKTEETYNPYCYTGREFDSHDLYYYRARYYDPNVGRFISQDPIEFLAGDVNFYRYVGNDPVNWVNPSGLCGEGLCIGAALLLDAVFDLGLYEAALGLLGRKAAQQAGKVIVREVIDTAIEEDTDTDTTEAVKVETGINVKGEDVDCGDYMPYKDQKNPSKKDLERDHIPSQAAMKKRAEKLLPEGVELTKCIKNRLKNWADTLALPKATHKAGRTNGSKNTPEQIKNDEKDLGEAGKNDAKEYEDKMDDQDIPEECKEKIKDALDIIKNTTDEEWTDFIKKQIAHCANK